MEFKISKPLLILALLGLFAGSFILGRIFTPTYEDDLSEAIQTLQDTVKHYEVTIAGKQYELTQKDQIILTKEQAIESGLMEKERWRKLYLRTITSNTELQGQVDILLDSIATIKPQIIYITTGIDVDSVPCLRLPTDFIYDDRWVRVVGHMNEMADVGLKIDMPVKLDVVIGRGKKGKPMVGIIEENPYFRVTNINSIVIKDKNSWIYSPWLKFGAGLAAGIGVAVLVK